MALEAGGNAGLCFFSLETAQHRCYPVCGALYVDADRDDYTMALDISGDDRRADGDGCVFAASDGSMLVTDDGSNSIWRVDYIGH
jgi:hypothetical protein